MRAAIVCGLLFVSANADAAVQFACHEETASRTTSCVDLNGITANGDIRASQLYTGGPKTVKPTGHLFISDCKKGISVLQDRAGVNFGAGPSDATRMSKELSDFLCAAKRVRKDSTLTY
jgi:hypothetical protein